MLPEAHLPANDSRASRMPKVNPTTGNDFFSFSVEFFAQMRKTKAKIVQQVKDVSIWFFPPVP
jgi:hypothetical protein